MFPVVIPLMNENFCYVCSLILSTKEINTLYDYFIPCFLLKIYCEHLYAHKYLNGRVFYSKSIQIYFYLQLNTEVVSNSLVL